MTCGTYYLEWKGNKETKIVIGTFKKWPVVPSIRNGKVTKIQEIAGGTYYWEWKVNKKTNNDWWYLLWIIERLKTNKQWPVVPTIE